MGTPGLGVGADAAAGSADSGSRTIRARRHRRSPAADKTEGEMHVFLKDFKIGRGS